MVATVIAALAVSAATSSAEPVPQSCKEIHVDPVSGNIVPPDPVLCAAQVSAAGPVSTPEALPTPDTRLPDLCQPLDTAMRPSAGDDASNTVTSTCTKSGGRREHGMSYCNQAVPPHDRCAEDHSRHDWSFNAACAVDCGNNRAARAVCQRVSVNSDGSRLYSRTCHVEFAASYDCSQESRCWGYVFVGNDESYTSKVEGAANYSQ